MLQTYPIRALLDKEGHTSEKHDYQRLPPSCAVALWFEEHAGPAEYLGRNFKLMRGGMAQSVEQTGSLYRPKAWWHGSVGRAHRSHRLGRGAEAPPVADEARWKRSEQRRDSAAPRRNRDYCELDRPKGDRWFESNCHHQSSALENQGLHLLSA